MTFFYDQFTEIHTLALQTYESMPGPLRLEWNIVNSFYYT